jgi:hypothetical protein
MQILLDMDKGANLKHVRNPRRHSFYSAKMVPGTTSPGLSSDDDVFRDPWGNPYIVSMDMNGDDLCVDAVYSKIAGADQVGLANVGGTNVLRGTIMIWSFGPDGKADPGTGAKVGVNKDNVLSWQ